MNVLEKETLIPLGLVLSTLSLVWSFSGRYHSLEDRVQVLEKSQALYITELKIDVKEVKQNLNDIQRTVDRMDERSKNNNNSNNENKKEASIRMLEDFIKSTKRPKGA